MSTARAHKKLAQSKPDLLSPWLDAEKRKNNLVFDFIDEAQLIKTTETSKTLKSSILSYNENKFYRQISQFIDQTNDTQLKELLEKHRKAYPRSTHLNELVKLIDAPLQVYLKKINDQFFASTAGRFPIETFQYPIELLSKPRVLRHQFSKGLQESINEMEDDLNLQFFHQCHEAINVPLFIKHGANFNYRNGSFTVFQKAVQLDAAESVKAMILAGADVNSYSYCSELRWGGVNSNMSVLMMSSADGNLSVVKTLLAYNTDINKSFPPSEHNDNENQFGIVHSYETALHLAAKYNRTTIANILIKAGADLNLQNDAGDTPLLVALQSDSDGVAKLILQSYPEKININHANHSKETALMLASGANNPDLVKLILRLKPDTSLRDQDGQTALEMAMDAVLADAMNGGSDDGSDAENIVDFLKRSISRNTMRKP